MGDTQMTEFLSGVIGAVEADGFAQHMLWCENRARKAPTTWDERPSGFLETVGHINRKPVCVSLSTAVIGGHKVLFYHATSQLVDHRMVDKWLIANLPSAAFREDGYPNKTDAMNFHNVFPKES